MVNFFSRRELGPPVVIGDFMAGIVLREQQVQKCLLHVYQQWCNTHASGWLNGANPTVADGQVTRTVCFHWGVKLLLLVEVINCGGCYVYFITSTPVCSLSYCSTDCRCWFRESSIARVVLWKNRDLCAFFLAISDSKVVVIGHK